MKLIRVILILLAIAAVLSLGAFLYSKRTATIATDTQSPLVSTSPMTNQQNPSDAGVKISTNTPAREITIEASEYKFNPSEITIKKGETVKITLKNAGRMSHNWIVEGMGGASLDMTEAGKQNSIVVTASQKGSFVTFCSIGNHRKLGMVGKLIVQ